MLCGREGNRSPGKRYRSLYCNIAGKGKKHVTQAAYCRCSGAFADKAGVQPTGHSPSSRPRILTCNQTAIRSPGLSLDGLDLRNIHVIFNCMDYYSFTDPGGINGWVGLVGRPIAVTLPTKWPSVKRRSAKVRQPNNDVLTTEPRRQIDCNAGWLSIMGTAPVSTLRWIKFKVKRSNNVWPWQRKLSGIIHTASRPHVHSVLPSAAVPGRQVTLTFDPKVVVPLM